ncbi:MAG: acyloxyacyl hydrolase [Flavobacteriaceae bacterium]|nr:acyloxyacyl hydrolase [Flavobacteriaceae bacterium]
MNKVCIIFLFSFLFIDAQEPTNNATIEFDYFYGNVLEHSPELKPIIQGHPSGFIISWNKKNIGNSQFENTYNFPDFGFSATYHDFNTEILGKVYSGYAHYNFYLNNRNAKNQLKLTTAFGLGYATNPFDKVTNNKNWAIGSKFLASVYLKFNYQREYVLDKLGVNAGFALIHYSNASFNAPNLGINTLALTAGVHYNFDDEIMAPERTLETSEDKYPIKYNAVLRLGVNESKINGSGLFPFYTVSLFIDKKLNSKSTISAGTDVFLATFMKEYIKHENSINGENNTADWKKVGIFIGYELNMEKFSMLTQVGYHVYDPYKYVSGIYEHFGFRKRFNEHLYADLTLKINLFRAEGLEFGFGYRF